MENPVLDFTQASILASFPPFRQERIFRNVPTILTERLRLRALRADDLQGIWKLYSDPEVGRFNAWTPLESLAEAEEKLRTFADQFAQSQRVRWGIAFRNENEVIGDIGMVHFDHRLARAEVGFNLALNHQGKGIMSEALRAILRYGFRTIGLHRMEGLVLPQNTPCHRLLQAVGFRREGILRKASAMDGQQEDLWLFGILPEEVIECIPR